jgi:hypothetical protein
MNALFGCSHRRTTFPQTSRRGRTYVACLECGQEFAYDWSTMRLGEPVAKRLAVAKAQPIFR